jgi:tetratricopeptide (TPR) repeat protein
MILNNRKGTRILIMAMTVLVFITVLFASRHYRAENLSVDPRVVPARKLYESYNALSVKNDFAGVFRLLESIDSIYKQYPHYRASFETGVLENNRAAAYLTLGLSYDSLTSPYHHLGQDSLISLGESAARKSIGIYEAWLDEYADKNTPELREKVLEDFYKGAGPGTSDGSEQYIDKRISEIEAAIRETPRRLSVSYTNLGIVFRYRENYQEAADCYIKAKELWGDNLTAENNLNKLLGRPLKKRSFIQKMFPRPGD